MKKQIINKILMVLLIATLVTPPTYGNQTILKTLGLTAFSTAIATTVGLPYISVKGLIGGGTAMIVKAIIDLIPRNNNQQNTTGEQDNQTKKESVNNILLSGFIGAGISELSLPKALIGAGLAYVCNKLYDAIPKTTRDYDSYRTAFMSGAIGAALLPTLALAAMGAGTGLAFAAIAHNV